MLLEGGEKKPSEKWVEGRPVSYATMAGASLNRRGLHAEALIAPNRMAFEKFTERARSIVDLATAEAKNLGCHGVDTVHLLLGMFREGKGVAGNVLRSEGIDAETVLSRYDQYRNAEDISLADFEYRCLFQAKWLHHNYVGTEHCILAICSFPYCRAAKVLSDMGVAPKEICREVLSLLGHEEKFDQWVAQQPQSP